LERQWPSKPLIAGSSPVVPAMSVKTSDLVSVSQAHHESELEDVAQEDLRSDSFA
jgi:hypothetical protein